MLRRLKFLLLGFSLIAVGGAWYFTTTPYYPMVMCLRAIKNQDVKSFEYYCDADSFSTSIVDAIINIEADLLGKDFTGVLKSLQEDPQKIPFAKMMMSRAVKTQLIKFVKGPRNNGQGTFASAKSDFESFHSFGRTYNNENNAVVVKSHFEMKDKKIVPLDIRLRKINGVWKIVGIESLAELLKVYNPFQPKN